MKWFVAVTVLVGSSALAQSKAGNDNAKVQPSTQVHFEDDLIEGTSREPDAQFVTGVLRPRQPSLIQVREHFRDKALESLGPL